jgi:hypothetical protein
MKRARNRDGSVVLDKRIKTWNFFWWEKGRRHSKKLGTKRQYPTKAAAWRAAQALRLAVENQRPARNEAPTVETLVKQYRVEKMPTRSDTNRCYESWISVHILPKWAENPITDLQARPVEMWLDTLPLAPKEPYPRSRHSQFAVEFRNVETGHTPASQSDQSGHSSKARQRGYDSRAV